MGPTVRGHRGGAPGPRSPLRNDARCPVREPRRLRRRRPRCIRMDDQGHDNRWCPDRGPRLRHLDVCGGRPDHGEELLLENPRVEVVDGHGWQVMWMDPAAAQKSAEAAPERAYG